MTWNEFLKKYNNAPYHLEEVAQLISTKLDKTNNKFLIEVAKKYLYYEKQLLEELKYKGYRFG